MFDRAFKPFVLRQDCISDGARDLIDACVSQKFISVQKVIESDVVFNFVTDF